MCRAFCRERIRYRLKDEWKTECDITNLRFASLTEDHDCYVRDILTVVAFRLCCLVSGWMNVEKVGGVEGGSDSFQN